MSFTDHDVAVVRHVVQRILVPCVFVIGLLGNSVSIYVLTRRRMRCTTNIYLTALAITDIMYLTMTLFLSFQHDQYVHLYCKIYWMCYGVAVWLCDACSYISIYIAVCFTIERFIAIRYPLKRQTFCTESLAKKVIAGVTLFCLLSTISTAFEHQYSIEYRMMDNHGRPCNQTVAKAFAIQQQQQQQLEQQQQQQQQQKEQHKDEIPLKVMENFVEFRDDETEGSGERNDRKFILSPNIASLKKLPNFDGTREKRAEKSARRIKRRGDLRKDRLYIESITFRTPENIPTYFPDMPPAIPYSWRSDGIFTGRTAFETYDGPDTLDKLMKAKATPSSLSLLEQKDSNYSENVSNTELPLDGIYLNVTDFCENVTYYTNKPTALGNDYFYITVWYFVTLCVFVVIPLCVLVTFNCFLIMLVRRSNTIRGEMTNANSIRRPKRKSNSTSVSQENRVTITLIAVVLLFIVCQLPWAVYLIVSCQIEIESHLQVIFGNIFNFFTATNAAANFFLYCVLSDKYRKTIREMITGYRYKQQRNTLTTTSLYTNGSRRSYRNAGTTSLVIK